MGVVGLKIDISKAFDRLKWSFLIDVLKSFGLSGHWCKLIYQCISTTSISIMLNGSPCKSYRPTRGPRYLSIICMESVSRYLIYVQQCQLVHGFKVTKHALSISHLLLADDCLIFAKYFHVNAENLMSLIKDFSLISVKVINFEKLGYFFSHNVGPNMAFSLIRTLNVMISLNEKYLGIPLFITRSKNDFFVHLSSHFDKRVSKWSGKNINHAGRYVFVEHLLKASSVYHMNTFSIPDNIIHQMELSQRDS